MTNTKTPIQAQIFSILSCVSYDMREAVEKDLWAMVGQVQAELNLANEQREKLHGFLKAFLKVCENSAPVSLMTNIVSLSAVGRSLDAEIESEVSHGT